MYAKNMGVSQRQCVEGMERSWIQKRKPHGSIYVNFNNKETSVMWRHKIRIEVGKKRTKGSF